MGNPWAVHILAYYKKKKRRKERAGKKERRKEGEKEPEERNTRGQTQMFVKYVASEKKLEFASNIRDAT